MPRLHNEYPQSPIPHTWKGHLRSGMEGKPLYPSVPEGDFEALMVTKPHETPESPSPMHTDVVEALSKLHPIDKALIEMVTLSHYSIREAAKHLDISKSWAATRLTRTLNRLQKELNNEGSRYPKG